VWVTDFGLAKADDHQNLTHTGDILGTLRYMPPEAFEGKTDVRSDVYSLGLTLYEMLAFRPGFDERERNRLIKQVAREEPARLHTLNRAIPTDLETIVHKAIERTPGQRYATAAELAADLQQFLDDEPIQARRASLPERFWRRCKRNPIVAGLTAAVFVLLSAVAVVASVGYAQTRLALGLEANAHAEADRQRQLAVNSLYQSLVREAQAIRRARNNGYRQEVWDRLKQALSLETPDKDPDSATTGGCCLLGGLRRAGADNLGGLHQQYADPGDPPRRPPGRNRPGRRHYSSSRPDERSRPRPTARTSRSRRQTKFCGRRQPDGVGRL
jgi:hypothetical protein